MSKYEPLGAFLQSRHTDEVPMTFAQIERLTGSKLPPSARYRAWWSNNPSNSVMTKVWLQAGFRSEKVNLKAGKLVFRRVRGGAGAIKTGAGATRSEAGGEGKRHPLFGALKGLMRIAPNTDLTKPADPTWGDRS
ncbi:MAG: hypothetical protein WD871_04905 [Xanthobacteraceae bacterium]